MNSIYQTALAFASQNMGAKKLDRVDDVLKKSLLVVSGVGLFFGVGAYLLGEILLRLYTPNQEVIDIAMLRLMVISTSYFLCGIMDVYSGVIRGMGFSFTPMLVSMFFVCAFRVFWIYTIFERFHEQWVLYISYPVSWTITIIAYFFTYKIVRKKAKEKILKMS